MALHAQAIRIVLTVAMLAGALPTWQHSHSGGDQEHFHATLAETGPRPAAIDHSHRAGHPQGAQSNGHRHYDGCGHPHRHIWLLGIVLTLPAGDEDSNSSNDRTYEGAIGLLASETSTVVDSQAVAHLFSLFTLLPVTLEPAQTRTVFRFKPAMVAPLCDTARHERSGVQLI